MGACQSTGEARAIKVQSDRVEKELRTAHAADRSLFKLLLLGTGESGKSTIFKQMQLLYSEQKGFTQKQKETYRHVVRRNVVESMQVLLRGAAKLGYRLSSQRAIDAATAILSVDPFEVEFWTPMIVTHIHTLWLDNGGEDAIRKAFDERSRLQLPDSAPYLFDCVDSIGDPNYTPTDQHILRARLRTSGIVEKKFDIEQSTFLFIDVGGQRNERRKWIHCFEGVTAVIFVAAISEYDQAMWESEEENRMKDALNVFENITNNRIFERSAMILFLNKKDLFAEKIKHVPLTVCFEDYEGDNSYDDAVAFIHTKFVELNRADRLVYVHVTCATDTDHVAKVFEACKQTILKFNLEKLGLS